MIEYFIYTMDEGPVEIVPLRETLADAGWTMYAVRNWHERILLEVVADGELHDDDWTIAHRIDSPLAADVHRALTGKDQRALDQWIDSSELSFATWSTHKFVFARHSEFESLDDARRSLGDQYADFVASARRQYIVQTGIDPEFGAAAMGAVAMLQKGIVEDPQLGVVLLPPATAHEVAEFIHQWPTDDALIAAQAQRVEPTDSSGLAALLSDQINKQAQRRRSWWDWVDENNSAKHFSFGRTARLLVVIFGGYAIVMVPFLLIRLGVDRAQRAKQERLRQEQLDREWAKVMQKVQEGDAGEAFKRLFSSEARPRDVDKAAVDKTP